MPRLRLVALNTHVMKKIILEIEFGEDLSDERKAKVEEELIQHITEDILVYEGNDLVGSGMNFITNERDFHFLVKN